MKLAVTISGSFQKAIEMIRADIEEFESLGCTVLSPRMFHSHRNEDGFVILDSDGSRRPAAIHGRHLVSINQSNLLWVRNPGGYIGLSTALEIGCANTVSVPIYASEKASDSSINRYVEVVPSPAQAWEKVKDRLKLQESKSWQNQNIQAQVAQMSAECGFDKEEDNAILALLDKEIDELKEAVAKEKFSFRDPHGVPIELADCAIYLYHLANQTGTDLCHAITEKISINLERWGRKYGAAS